AGASAIAGQKPVIFPEDDEIAVSNVALFPNPATDFVQISNTNDETVQLVVFYDSQGRICKQTHPLEQIVVTSDLLPGVYTVETRLTSRSIFQSLVIR
ncbi:MAG: T9SS type A sorting domain-containing protein, partial [Flavobacteriales bacterium]|nr:T9SS type A sorting domain-containing protein [Flavobacteriales bacterium]